MTVTDVTSRPTRTPTDLVGTVALVVAPVLYLAVDTLYALRGWADPTAGLLHVLGAIAYVFVVLRLAAWARGRLAAATAVAGVVGGVGNAAYGFDTISVSLGAVSLVDVAGPGAVIKPLGLVWPLALLLGAVVLAGIGRRTAAVLVGLAGALWPVAHIANIGWLAVAVNLLLVAGLVPLAFAPDPATR